jgi:TPR repeat protein
MRETGAKPLLARLNSRRPTIRSILLVAITALTIGSIQEYRWRTITPIKTNLDFAEQAIQTGDNQTALTLFSKLAAQSNPNAEYWLGLMNEIGLGTARDSTKAVALYKKAAEKNIVAAEARLGEIYLNGELAPPDFSQARSFLDRAAYHGDSHSAMLLGQIYLAGVGTAVDAKQAYAWSEVATVEGSDLAISERNSSLRNLAVSDKQAAVAQAHEMLMEIKRQTSVLHAQQIK